MLTPEAQFHRSRVPHGGGHAATVHGGKSRVPANPDPLMANQWLLQNHKHATTPEHGLMHKKNSPSPVLTGYLVFTAWRRPRIEANVDKGVAAVDLFGVDSNGFLGVGEALCESN